MNQSHAKSVKSPKHTPASPVSLGFIPLQQSNALSLSGGKQSEGLPTLCRVSQVELDEQLIASQLQKSSTQQELTVDFSYTCTCHEDT